MSDGLIADAGHIGEASGLGLEIDLNALPISSGAGAWCAGQTDSARARLALATGGDDYAIVCAIPIAKAPDFIAAVESLAIPVAKIGAFGGAAGVRVIAGGRPVEVLHTGWRHSGRPEIHRLKRACTGRLALPGRFWQFPAALRGGACAQNPSTGFSARHNHNSLRRRLSSAGQDLRTTPI